MKRIYFFSSCKSVCITASSNLSFWALYSVARTFLPEIADFLPIYRQIRQVFGPISRKIRHFLPVFLDKKYRRPVKKLWFTPSSKNFQFYSILSINIFENGFSPRIFLPKKGNKKKIFSEIYDIFGAWKILILSELFLVLFLVKVLWILPYFAKFASLTIKYLKFAKFANSWDSKSPLAMYRQLKFPIATELPKIADLAIYRQKC